MSKQRSANASIFRSSILKVSACLGAVCSSFFLAAQTNTAGNAFPEPFWSGNTLKEDPVLFTSINGSVPEGKLMTVPEKILKVTNLDRTIEYKEGEDFEIVSGTSTLRLTKNSRIPFFTEEQLYPPAGSPRGLKGKVNSDRYMFWCRDSYLPAHQIRVTYTHKDTSLPRPEQIYGKLPKTFEKIRSGKPMVFAVFGDSISCGYNSSKFLKFAPFDPMHFERFETYLEKKTGADSVWYNRSKAGYTAGWGAANLEERFSGAQTPDFVFIGWGMNDITAKIPVENFINHIKKQMELFRKLYPETEFVLMSTMYANGEWSLTNIPEFEVYRQALLKLADDNGVMIADHTKIWELMIRRKGFMSLSGNGLNHPNDFGHKVYADVIIDAFERGMNKQ